MNQLKSISIKEFKRNDFPFNLEIIKNFDELIFNKSVTFFIGENGAGKSTLIEAIAAGIGLPTIGSESIERDITLKSAAVLAEYLKLSWNIKSKKGFFFRAEDFFGFVKSINQMQLGLDDEIKHFESELSGEALMRVKGTLVGEKQSLIRRYGNDLNANSHGESFLKLFESRFTQKGVYILDEPEASLSPQRQLTLISIIKNMVAEKDAQFIIATHSPILMGFPDATIYEFKAGHIKKIKYEDTEHYQITRGFLENRERYLRYL